MSFHVAPSPHPRRAAGRSLPAGPTLPAGRTTGRPRRISTALSVLAALATVSLAAPAAPLAAQEKPAITVDDYGSWKDIGSVALSPDGSWMTYAYEPLEGDDTLFVRSLDRDDAPHAVPRGSSAAFSRDGQWVGYMVSPPERNGEGEQEGRPGAQAQRGGGNGGPPSRSLILRSLASADSLVFPDVQSFQFPENTDLLLVRKRGPGQDAEHEGADLVVHALSDGTSLNLGNVSEFGVNEPGTHLAYLVDARDQAGNGLFLLDLSAQTIATVDSDPSTYEDLAWHEDGASLAALRGEVPEGRAERDNVLLVVRDVNRPDAVERLDPAIASGVPAGLVLSERGSLGWSEDGSRLFLGTKEQIDDRDELEGRANVDVWHWKDVQPQSVQEVRAERNRNQTWDAVVNLTGNGLQFVQLADPEGLASSPASSTSSPGDATLESVSQAGTSKWGLGRDGTPYEYEVTWGGSPADYYRVDLDTGERTPLATRIGRQMGASPDGAWWLFLRDEHVVAHRLEDGHEVDLTASSGVDFIDRQDDHPYELPAHGVAGWSDDGASVLLYDRWDVWQVPLDGSEAVNLTAGIGERDRIRFRVTEFSEAGGGRGSFFGFGGGDDDRIDLDEPLLLSAYGDRTKKNGYWSLEVGDEPEPLLWLDESVGRPMKAADSDRVVLTRETFVEYPDYWLTDTDFSSFRQITDANPQQADYAWSPGRVLIDYTDSRGNELQATLGLPADYQEGERYPMLVYFYETMSQRHHSYQGPAFDDRPHMATYASNGYLVLQPDIVYTIGEPGTSALDDLTAVVEKVIELGYADPDRIGLQGHSWSGYQSSFVVTQTDLFSAVVTGAPPTNLISFYNTLYKRTGTVQQGITEVGQVRMGTTPFEDFDLYVSQSPVHHAGDITTPFMILHGTEDGAVDWMQGLEYFNMARRQGKEVVLLSYPGEPHHLNEKPNQIDFQIRMMQFFDHHLKDAVAPLWLVEGVEHLEKDFADPRVMSDGSRWGEEPEGAEVAADEGGGSER